MAQRPASIQSIWGTKKANSKICQVSNGVSTLIAPTKKPSLDNKQVKERKPLGNAYDRLNNKLIASFKEKRVSNIDQNSGTFLANT